MKKAFTLAEVLITLGIIGIVAAMTLPAITGHYRKKIVEVKLKRFYSTFSNILMRSEVDNETMQFWEWPQNSYKDDEGNIRVEVIMKDENVWLNTLSIAKLFNADMLLQSILIILFGRGTF